MHRNGRTIKLSSLHPNLYSLPPRESGIRPTIVCPDCGTHRVLYRTLIHPHRAEVEITPGVFTEVRCSGSGTKVVFDVTAEDWDVALRKAVRAVEGPLPACFIGGEVRRSNRVMLKPEPAPDTPVHLIAVAC